MADYQFYVMEVRHKQISDIKPNSFKPKPKVDSSLLFYSEKKFYKIKNPKNLEKITRIFLVIEEK